MVVFRIKFPLDSVARNIRDARNQLQQDRANLHQILGVQLLSLTQLAYVEKARGGTGSDGIRWAPLKRSSIKARILQRLPGKTIIRQRRDLARQIEDLTGVPEVKTRKPTKPTKRRTGTAATKRKPASSPTPRLKQRLDSMSKGTRKTLDGRVQQLRRKRLQLLVKLEGMVDAEMARYEIGVNTGLQRSSARPGFTAGDGKGGNVLLSGPAGVTVGYGREYSGYFDARRRLMPTVLPAAWRRRLEEQAQRWADKITREALGKKS